SDVAPRWNGFFRFSISARSRSFSAFKSSSGAMMLPTSLITHASLTFSSMTQIQAIFFDFDGVLLDTEPVHWACWAEVLRTAGLDLTWEYSRDECIGIDDRDMLRAMARQADPPRDWDSLWALYPTKKELFQARMTTPPFDPMLKAMLPDLARDYR